jgi:hypothetical protein
MNENVIKKCETLDDRIQLWTQCQAAMTLIKISSACILHEYVLSIDTTRIDVCCCCSLFVFSVRKQLTMP